MEEELEPEQSLVFRGPPPWMKPWAEPPIHLGGERCCLPVVVQHLVTGQAVIVHNVPLDSPEEVWHLILYQPGLARRALYQHPAFRNLFR